MNLTKMQSIYITTFIQNYRAVSKDIILTVGLKQQLRTYIKFSGQFFHMYVQKRSGNCVYVDMSRQNLCLYSKLCSHNVGLLKITLCPHPQILSTSQRICAMQHVQEQDSIATAYKRPSLKLPCVCVCVVCVCVCVCV